MTRSFGVGGNGRMGGGGGAGGGGGGGAMLRTVQRAVRAGVGGAAQEPFSHSSTTTIANANSSSSSSFSSRHNYKSTTSHVFSLFSSTISSPFSSFNRPISAISTPPTWPSSCSSPTGSEDFEWECVDGSEYERPHVFYDDFAFGSVPSKDEVQHAVSALQQVLDPASSSQFVKDRLAYNSDKDLADEITSPTGLVNRVSSVGTELDWIEPSLQLCSPRMLHPYGSHRVYDAFHLLQTEPCIQRMVVSLSSDKAVWDAVLNNEVVRELRESLSEVDKTVHANPDDSSDGSNAAMNILSWIFDNTKAKAMALIEKITKLVNELFQPLEHEKTTAGGETDPFEKKLRTSFLLSILVLLIVVVNRAHRA